MSGALPYLSLGMQAIGGMMQGSGARQEAEAEAATLEENARLSILAGEQDAEQIMRDERMMAGEAFAQLGSSGGMVGEGTSADILAESVWQRERAIAQRRIQAVGQARNYRQQAEDRRAAGRAAMVQAAFGTVAGVLAGAADIRANRIGAGARASVRAAQGGNSAQRGTGALPTGRRLPAALAGRRGNG